MANLWRKQPSDNLISDDLYKKRTGLNSHVFANNEFFGATGGTSVNVTTDVGVITFVGFAPTIELPINIQPQTGTIVYFGQRPTIETPVNVNTQVGNLLYSGFEPTVSNSSSSGAQYWNGAAWVTTSIEYWDGAAYQMSSAQYYNGSIWVAV